MWARSYFGTGPLICIALSRDIIDCAALLVFGAREAAQEHAQVERTTRKLD